MSERLLRVGNWEALAKQAKFRPADMAALCPISLRQMERFFLMRFGKTPTEWTRELRCQVALQLIREGRSNKGIAEDLGFTDSSHFCHEFKRIYGASPQTFAPIYRADPPVGLTLRIMDTPALQPGSADTSNRLAPEELATALTGSTPETKYGI